MLASLVYPAAIVALVLSSSLSSASSSHNAIRRPNIPRRLDTEALSDPIAERGLLDALFRRYKGRATWYGVGVTMGACGKWTSTDSRAVALNIGLYGNPDAQSGWCGKKIKITANGRTSIAEVVDCCPTCPGNGDLDMSKALFRDFASIDDGVFQMSWSWVGAGDGNDDDDNDESDKPKGGNNGGGKKPEKQHNNNNNDDDEEDDDDKPKKEKPKPKPTHTSKDKETETETKTKTKSTKTKTATATVTSTESEDVPEETQRKKQHSNLDGLSKVISGFQNLAISNHN
ncbi:hypothetical protein OC861_005527 [Tilletia horrida]|nr:hypothetical protein OC861_005527 [Tilletia horrida]